MSVAIHPCPVCGKPFVTAPDGTYEAEETSVHPDCLNGAEEVVATWATRDRAEAAEARVKQLEIEVQWLLALIRPFGGPTGGIFCPRCGFPDAADQCPVTKFARTSCPEHFQCPT